MKFSILTLFPEYFRSPLQASLLGKAIDSKKIEVETIDLRQFGEGKYRSVDDSPYGGGAGMVLMPHVLEKAYEKVMAQNALSLEDLERSVEQYRANGETHLNSVLSIYLSPQAPEEKKLTAKNAQSYSKYSNIVLLCGHYEGVDERVIQSFVHDEVSIGDYILTGGEPAALVLMDAIARFCPGIVGSEASVECDTFGGSSEMMEGGLKAPSYTRPQVWRGQPVPSVLLSGNHQEITKWRKLQSVERTKKRRPGLL